MMEFIKRRLPALLVSIMVGLASIPVSAEELADDQINERPSATAMFGDAVVGRPMLLLLTATGTALFLVTLPFSALGGNVAEAGKTLVVGPAKSTFLRCLGCTATQDAWKNKQVAGDANNPGNSSN